MRQNLTAPAAESTFVRRYGPWALVSGATDGIGREFAHQLAARGVNVVLVARRATALEEVAAELTHKHHIACRVIAADLADQEAMERLVQATSDIDVGIVVAAAGFGTSGPFLDAPLAAEIEMLTVNCAAVLAMAWHYGRQMAERGHGGLVLMGSLLGFAGVGQSANYAATKAYVQSLAEGLRREFAPLGVDVISSAPGPVRSGFADRAQMRMSATTAPDVVARATLRALGRTTTVRPGALSKLLGWSLAMVPRATRGQILTQVMRSMTAHQKSDTSGGATSIHAIRGRSHGI